MSLPPISTSESSPAIGRCFGVAFDLALVGDLRPVAIHQRTVFFHRLDGGARLAQLLDLLLELLFRDFDGRLVDGNDLVALDGEVGNVLEDRLHVQRLAVFHGQLRHLRLADGPDAQVAHRLVEALRQQAVDDFLANLGGKAAANDRLRHLAGAEAGNLGIFAVVGGHAAVGLRDLVGGNVEHQFAGAFRVQNRAVVYGLRGCGRGRDRVVAVLPASAASVGGCLRWCQ